MLVDKTKFWEGYEQLTKDARQAPLEIFTSAADCDSCCAFRILKSMLESDNLTYSVLAVSGYDDLLQRMKQLPRDDKERAVVLINCGGTENLEELLGLKEMPNTRLFVFDSHRPLDLRNLDDNNSSVLVFRDVNELTPEGDGPLPVLDDDKPSGSGSSSDDDDGDGDEEDEEEEHAARRQRVGEAGEAHRTAVHRRERRRRREEARRRRIEYFSRGCYYGRPAGCLLYDVAHQRRKDELDHHAPLWYAIVALTDQYVHQRLSYDAYLNTVLELAGRVSDLPQMDQPSKVMLEDGLVVKAFENRRIEYKKDFRFMLMRHWSLFDSLQHSPYVASSLMTWTEKGRAALKTMLAEMGLPLENCQDKFLHMPPKLLRELEKLLDDTAHKYGLKHHTFDTFFRSHGYKVRVSASDVVYSVTALIESANEDKSSWQDSFWRGVNALHESHYAELQEGISLAKSMQRAIMHQGGQILLNSGIGGDGKKNGAQGFVLKNRYYNHVDLNATGGANAAVFQQPMALLRLAIFLQDVLIVRFKRPLVVVSPADQNGMCTVVGVVGPPKLSDTKGNQFSLTFREAATESKASFVHDSFEASVIRVGSDHVTQFLSGLKDAMVELARNELA